MTNREEAEFMLASEVRVRFFTGEKKEDSTSDKNKIIICSTTQYSKGVVCDILTCLSQKIQVLESLHWFQCEGRAGGKTWGERSLGTTMTDHKRRWRTELHTSALGAERSRCYKEYLADRIS